MKFVSLTLEKHGQEKSNIFIRSSAWAEDAVEYETVIFAPSGFTEDGRPATPYEGPPSPELDARWHDLSKGMSGSHPISLVYLRNQGSF